MELLQEVEERYIKTNGIKLHTVIIGSGKPLILLHGFPDFWYGWKNVIMGLKDNYQLIVPDMRGYNLSDKPDGVENYDLNILADDIKGLSEELHLGKFYLAGHDWGGIVAWSFAEKYPDLLEKLIIINAPHIALMQKSIETNKTQRKASGYVNMLQQPGAENILLAHDCQALKSIVFTSEASKFDEEMYVKAWTQPGAILGGLNYYKANWDASSWTGIVDVPTLVIWGMNDPFLRPLLLDAMPDYVKDLKIVRVDAPSHWVMRDVPEIVNTNIKEFIH